MLFDPIVGVSAAMGASRMGCSRNHMFSAWSVSRQCCSIFKSLHTRKVLLTHASYAPRACYVKTESLLAKNPEPTPLTQHPVKRFPVTTSPRRCSAERYRLVGNTTTKKSNSITCSSQLLIPATSNVVLWKLQCVQRHSVRRAKHSPMTTKY